MTVKSLSKRKLGLFRPVSRLRYREFRLNMGCLNRNTMG